LIIGNQNAITYKEIFPYIKNNQLWLGLTMNGSNRWFEVPSTYEAKENAAGYKVVDGKRMLFVNGVTWFIAALFLMKIILAICNRHKYAEAIIIFIGIADAIIYLLNDYYMIFTDLPLVGFAKCLPFFFIGHLCKQKK
jgi:hypothetical protein